MSPKPTIKTSLIAKIVPFLVIFMCLLVVAPTFFKLGDSYPVSKKINLGLDLQGGLYMVLGIDFAKVYREELKSSVSKMIADFQEGVTIDKKTVKLSLTLGDENATDPRDPHLELKISGENSAEEVKDLIRKYFAGSSYLRLVQENIDAKSLSYALARQRIQEIESESVGKSIEVIRNRIDEFGVTEPEIVSQGSNRIVVQLPGVKDIERAKDLIGKTAKLEFKIVDNKTPYRDIEMWLKEAQEQGQITFAKGDKLSLYIEKLNTYLQAKLPKGFKLAFEKGASIAGAEDLGSLRPYLVEELSRLTGEDIQDARVLFDPEDQSPYVSLDFKTKGAQTFATLTAENVGKQMAIVLDGMVMSAPSINEKIGGGRARITLGSLNASTASKEASDLALVLRAGALPVQLDFEEQRVVGPSLGQDAIQAAEVAAIISALLIFIFIAIYYKKCGLVACLSLLLNVLIVLCCLVLFDATLTLPGIAGLALTVGMAVDASIVIFERIREEVRAGNPPPLAVERGFSSAFWTIFDANVTTAMAGIALINFGTGPVRGFAVTLLIGIVATVYSSYFASKVFFSLFIKTQKNQSLSI